jgi:hypothetical protein
MTDHAQPFALDRTDAAAQGRMCGTSVCPPLAAALVRANAPELATAEKAAA